MINILITGGSGFIGRNLTEYLQNKYQVFVPSHKELDLLMTDKVLDYIKKNKIDIIVHTANVDVRPFGFSQSQMIETNLRIFFNLVRGSPLVKKIIHLGTGGEYDKSRPIQKIKEEDFENRIPTDGSFYKYVCSKYIENSDKFVCLRIFGIYGKYEDYQFKFISNAIVKNLFKMDLVINQNVVFDYLFIDDLMPIMEFFIKNNSKFKAYNVTPTESIELLKICRIINSISKHKSKIKVLNPGLNDEYTGDNSRLKQEIPGLKFTDYEEGIKELFLYYRNNLTMFDKKIVEKDEYLKKCETKK